MTNSPQKKFLSISLIIFSLMFLISPLVASAATCTISPTEVFCGTCDEGDNCVSEGTTRGTCITVPAETAVQRAPSGATISPGQKICSTDGVHPAIMPTDDDDDSTDDSIPVAPTFAVNIPTVTISDAQTVTGFVDIPWISDYIVGVYRYGVFFGTILAAIMIMIGGIQWLSSGGNVSQIGAAKKRIVDATIALVILVGSFVILNVINPDLIALQPIRVQTVPPDPLELELNTTFVATRDASDSSYRVRQNRGTYTAQHFTSCPLSLPESRGEGVNGVRLPTDRERQFFEEIHPRLTGDISQRYVMAMEAAWKCEVQLGSCGRTLSDLAELVLSGPDADCLQQENRGRFPAGCMDSYQDRADSTVVRGWRDSRNDRNARISSQQLIQQLQRQNPGYPDNLDIRPGAIVTYYNANTSGGGSHRVWVGSYDSETGMAKLLSGQVGSSPTSHDVCFSSACGNFAPIGIISYLEEQ